ncbi:MAG: hypothetical protein HYV95_06240 [Opitutae bacterium]|nr:hypothetical protein [Opitutae bacterium]
MTKSRGAEFWRQQVDAQRASGLSVAGYCRMHGVGAWSFHSWRRRLEAKAPEAVRLIAVTIQDEVPAMESATTSAGIEVRLASGVVLSLARHFDGASLHRAVEALR